MTSERDKEYLLGAMAGFTMAIGVMGSSMVVGFLLKMMGPDALEPGRKGVTLNGLMNPQ